VIAASCLEPPRELGTASGVFNTGRQIGGALAVAVFGTLIGSADFVSGLRTSLLTAAVVALAAAAASSRLRASNVTVSLESAGGV
jgi:sugar phosphate permease